MMNPQRKELLPFLELVRAGLWENEVRISQYEPIDYKEVYRFAQEQSVVGLVAASLEYVKDTKIPSEVALTFAGEALQLEQRNKAMNHFIAALDEKMQDVGIFALLVKGQGVAQCYERPLWRACGDVDYLLDRENYQKAKDYFSSIAQLNEENEYNLHQSLFIKPWEVELHGTMRSQLFKKVEKEVDASQDDTFKNQLFRTWNNDGRLVYLLSPDNDCFFVFVHILQHFFKRGIGLRQICDWCRLLWTYREQIDIKLLEERISRAGLISEWNAFSSFVVEYLGMPLEAMPLYSPAKKWKKKAQQIMHIVLRTGNFGHNKDYSYYWKYPRFVQKIISLLRHTEDSLHHLFVFPLDTIRVWSRIVTYGFAQAIKGK